MFQYVALVLTVLCLAASPALAGFTEGKNAYQEKDWGKALAELRPAVDAGDDRAMFLLGKMYETGTGVTQSFQEALSLYKRAASEKNNTDAMVAIGLIWNSTAGIRQDIKTALKWFHHAAQLGNGTGAYYYAAIISGGTKTPVKDIPLDYYTAYKWFRIAVTADPEHSHYRGASENLALSLSMHKLKAADVAKADNEIKAWKPLPPASLGPLPPFPEIAAAR